MLQSNAEIMNFAFTKANFSASAIVKIKTHCALGNKMTKSILIQFNLFRYLLQQKTPLFQVDLGMNVINRYLTSLEQDLVTGQHFSKLYAH